MRLVLSRWSALVLVSVVLLLSLAACGGKGDADSAPAPTTPPQQTTVADTATPAPAPPTATPVPATATPEPVETPTPASSADRDADTAFPLPEDATDVVQNPDEITFVSALAIEELVEFYREALGADDWLELEDATSIDDDLAFMEFDRAEEAIFLTIFSQDGASMANFDLSSAPSLAGEQDDANAPDASGYTVADWPVPDDADDIDIVDNVLSFKTALSLVEVADFYRPTFALLDLGESCLENVDEYTSISCSSSNGVVTLNFFAFEGFDATEVEIDYTNNSLETPGDSGADDGELGVDEQADLPLPDDHTGYATDSSDYRRSIEATSPSSVETLTAFFQEELPKSGWTLDDEESSDTAATLHFSGPEGNLVVNLTAGDETVISMVARDPAAAEAAGILPPAGQARLYLISYADSDLTVTIDGQEIVVPAGAGMDSPDDAPTVDLAPGDYDVTTTVDGSSVTDQITVGADEVWGVLLDVQGALPLQMY